MLSALAPSGPVAQVVPTSPPSTTGTAQPVQRESFKDVYSNVPADDHSQNEAGPKAKSASSDSTKAKKNGDEPNGKVAVAAASAPHAFVLPKPPLALTLPMLAPSIAPHPDVDGSAKEKIGADESQGGQTSAASPVLAGGTDPNPAEVSSFRLPLPSVADIPAKGLGAGNEKLAFSARLTPSDTPKPQVQEPRPEKAQSSAVPARDDVRSTADRPAASGSKEDLQTPMDIKKAAASEAVLPIREASPGAGIDLRPTGTQSQPVESTPSQPAHTIAVQDVRPILPEAPKPPASSQILLQLTSQDQSTASVRVVDRSGTVNVTVHAADADLRSSLRSNLNDLASQLTSQGYKTEIVRPAVSTADTTNQHDSRQSGREASSQQQHQFTPEGRNPQRDRRTSSERWQDELERETTGADGAPGGKS